MNILENLYYGNIHPNEHSFLNGSDNSELIENAVRLEKNLLEQFEKADAEISDRHELQAFTNGFRLATRLMLEVYEPTPKSEL